MNKVERVPVKDEADIYVAAQKVTKRARELGFDRVSQTRLGTVTLELARNALVHGGGGEALLRRLCAKDRMGLEIQVIDHGPGIPDVERAMSDGYSTAGGLGTGLGAAQRLSDEFEIDSLPGGGTRVVSRSWRTTVKELV